VIADDEALEDAKMTLEVIKKTDPGVYDEIINDSLALINYALSHSILSAVDRLADPDQQPVAWMHTSAAGNVYFRKKPQDKVFSPQPVYLAPPPLLAWETLVESVRQMRDVNGMDGNWNCDPYMHGLFNGIEFSLSLLEVRAPQFRDAPKKWLCDLPKPRIFSSEASK
jgi:hypothetical protein